MEYIFIFVLGTLIGSFISVLVPRLKSGKPGIVFGRSQCVRCKRTLTARELIPVISYFIQHGRCLKCKSVISWYYPALEICTGLAYAAVIYLYGFDPSLRTILLLLYVTILIVVAFYDLMYQEIPDTVMIPSIIFALVMSLMGMPTTLGDALLGAAIPVGFFGFLIGISGGKWMGGGDLRLGAFMGLILGWQLTLVALGIAYLSGSIVGIFLITSHRRTRQDLIPFGPFLSLGAIYAILWGPVTVQWYRTLIGM